MEIRAMVDWDSVAFLTPCVVWNEGEAPQVQEFTGIVDGKPVFAAGMWTSGLPVLMALDDLGRKVHDLGQANERLGQALLKWQDVSLTLDGTLKLFGGPGTQEVLKKTDVSRAIDAVADLRKRMRDQEPHLKAVKG